MIRTTFAISALVVIHWIRVRFAVAQPLFRLKQSNETIPLFKEPQARHIHKGRSTTCLDSIVCFYRILTTIPTHRYPNMKPIARRRARPRSQERGISRRQALTEVLSCGKTTTYETISYSTTQTKCKRTCEAPLHRKGYCYYRFSASDGIRANLRGRFMRRKKGLWPRKRPVRDQDASKSQNSVSGLSNEWLPDDVRDQTRQNRRSIEPRSTFWCHKYIRLAALGFPTKLLGLCYNFLTL